MTLASGDWSPMRSSRESSCSACSSTFSGISASPIFLRYSSMIAFSPASENAICERLSPLRPIWRGTR